MAKQTFPNTILTTTVTVKISRNLWAVNLAGQLRYNVLDEDDELDVTPTTLYNYPWTTLAKFDALTDFLKTLPDAALQTMLNNVVPVNGVDFDDVNDLFDDNVCGIAPMYEAWLREHEAAATEYIRAREVRYVRSLKRDRKNALTRALKTLAELGVDTSALKTA